MSEKRGLSPIGLKRTSYPYWMVETSLCTAIFLGGMYFLLQSNLAIDIGKRFFWMRHIFDFDVTPEFLGRFLGMVIIAAVLRVSAIVVMQYSIEKSITGDFSLKNKSNALLIEFIKIVAISVIFLFIIRSSAYANSIADTWLSVFSTALWIHIFFGAIGDALKRLLFVARLVKNSATRSN